MPIPPPTEGTMATADTVFQYGRMLDALADPVVAADASNRIVYANGAVETLLGWPNEELIGQPLSVIQPERFHAAHAAAFERFLRTGKGNILGKPVRVPALHRDGTEIDIELSVAALGREDGMPVAVASLRDLRARVELERQLTVTRYLRASTVAASRLATLLNLDHVLQTIAETLVSGFDSALARIWLYERETETLRLRASAGLSNETTGSSRAVIDVRTHPYKIGEVARTRVPIIQNGLEGDPQFNGEWVQRERITAVACFPLVIGEELRGVLVHFTRGSIPDEVAEVLASFTAIATAAINDVQLLERAQTARAEAEEAVRIRDEFLSTVSHDLKNPLAAIKGRAQMLKRRAAQLPPEDAERFVDGLENIDGVTSRMTRLINDIVDLARLRIGQPLELNRGDVDLVALVGQVAAEQQESTDHHALHVESSIPSLMGQWDRSRLERVLANLLNNAIKYSPQGGDILIRIDREERDGQEVAMLQVTDSGIGIPSGDLPHIFKRYHRASNTIGIEGTGVGLAGARQIVEQHGGRISAASTEGQGTVFVVCLPVGVIRYEL